MSQLKSLNSFEIQLILIITHIYVCSSVHVHQHTYESDIYEG